jgi:hypothetical protein
VSRQAIQLCLPFASEEHIALLEQAALAYASDGGADDEREHWVWVQRLLLEAIGEDRLSEEGTARLHDLRARYPEQETAIPIKQESANFINSAISAAEAEKYSDEQWLAAMEKFHYGWEERGPRLRDGSAVELSRLLEPRVRTDRRPAGRAGRGAGDRS